MLDDEAMRAKRSGGLVPGGSVTNTTDKMSTRNTNVARPEYILKLYVTGDTSRSKRAIDNLRNITDLELQGRVQYTVIDVLQQPGLAEEHRIVATPTLVKEEPQPTRRIIGDLADRQKVLAALDIHT